MVGMRSPGVRLQGEISGLNPPFREDEFIAVRWITYSAVRVHGSFYLEAQLGFRLVTYGVRRWTPWVESRATL